MQRRRPARPNCAASCASRVSMLILSAKDDRNRATSSGVAESVGTPLTSQPVCPSTTTSGIPVSYTHLTLPTIYSV